MALVKFLCIGETIIFERLLEDKNIFVLSFLLSDIQDGSAVLKITNELEPHSYQKKISVGEFMEFNASGDRFISVKLSEVAGRRGWFKISADRSILIRHERLQVVSTGT